MDDPNTMFGTEFGPADKPYIGLPLLFDEVTGLIIVPNNIGDLKDRSLDAMLPGIRPRLSAVNSVIELKDFATLPHTLTKLKDGFTGLTRLAKSVPKLSKLIKSGASVGKVVRAAADIFLQSEFNIKPLLSDISGVTTTIRTIKQETQKLLANAGKRQLRHYQCPLVAFTDSTVPLRLGAWTGGNLSYYYNGVYAGYYGPAQNLQRAEMKFGRNVTYNKAMFHATIEYSYELDQYVRDNADLYGILDSLGVNFNPAIVWNAIPWSFVVDWVLGVSRWLNNYRIRLIEPRTTISNYCWSIAIDRTILVNFSQGAFQVNTPARSGSVSVVVERAYKRVNERPDYYSSLQRSGISQHEFMLGAALYAGSPAKRRSYQR